MLKWQKYLITGGLGLIGSHLAEKLLEQGYEVTILDNLSIGKISNLKRLESNKNLRIIEGDILDSSILDKEIKSNEFCFHLAASLGVNKILESPLASYKTNMHGSENVLSLASKNSVPVFLASTSEIYGDNPVQPLNEESKRVIGSPLNIRWAYSEAKALDESLAQIYSQEQGLQFVVGRFFNTVGPRQVGDYGMVLPRFVSAALSGEDLHIHGDGTQTRVFCHVLDAVEAILRIVREKSSFGEAFNIGGEEEISIEDLARLVLKVTHSNAQIKYIPYEIAYGKGFEETFRRVPDTSKLRKLTGWKPNRSLEETVRDVADSMKHV